MTETRSPDTIADATRPWATTWRHSDVSMDFGDGYRAGVADAREVVQRQARDMRTLAQSRMHDSDGVGAVLMSNAAVLDMVDEILSRLTPRAEANGLEGRGS